MLGFVNKIFISVQLIFFLDHVSSCWIGAKIWILQNSCMTKWFYETELREIYLNLLRYCLNDLITKGWGLYYNYVQIIHCTALSYDTQFQMIYVYCFEFLSIIDHFCRIRTQVFILFHNEIEKQMFVEIHFWWLILIG